MTPSTKRTFSYLLFILISLFSISCSSNLDEKNNLRTKSFIAIDYDLLKLNGKVKSLEINLYNANDSLIDSESYKFNILTETIEHKSKNIYGIQFREINLYNDDRTNLIQETYKNSRLIERQTTIDSLDANDNVIKKSTYDIKNNLVEVIDYLYFSNGELASMNSKRLDNGEFSKRTYYQDSNNILRKGIYVVYDRDSTQTKNIKWKYDSLGKPVLDEMYSWKDSLDFRNVFKYDSLNNLVEHIHFFSDTSFYWKRRINYSKEGIKVDSICHFYWSPNPKEEEIRIHNEEIHEFNKSGDIIKQTFKDKEKVRSVIVSRYSEDNFLKEEVVTHPNEQTIRTKFDTNGNPISKQVYDNGNNIVSEEKYDIEYDFYNNFTKVTIQKDGLIQSSIKRKYQYY